MKTTPTIIAARERKEHKSGKAPLCSLRSFAAIVISFLFAATAALAQVNSGSDGHDGAFNPTTNTVINMADHPDGIYQYTSVNISNGVTVTFIPNAANTPVVWLVQSNCVISGTLILNAANVSGPSGAAGGAGGFRGGTAQLNQVVPTAGQGPGGGKVSYGGNYLGGNASFGGLGDYRTNNFPNSPPGDTYGNSFLVPLIGGSGGSGSYRVADGTMYGGPAQAQGGSGGGGGGGAILIAASGEIQLDAGIFANGSGSDNTYRGGGGGSGGAVRLVATKVKGGGYISCGGGSCFTYYNGGWGNNGGAGRVRIDAFEDTFNGGISATTSTGFQPIIIPPANQAVSLAIQSIGGIAVAANPTGAPTTPDVVVPGVQQNPVSIVVRCVNIPLNTDIIVEVKPANGPSVRVVGANNVGTQASSTATVSVTMPRGAGTIQAKCVSSIAGSLGASLNNGEKFKNYAQSGLTADGEVFAKMEITATLGRGQEITYITESGNRYSLPSR